MKTITVGNGFIASCLNYPIVPDRIFPNYKSVGEFLDDHNPEILINCVGFCGTPDIDACELDKQKTFDINTILPIMLASACEKRNIRFINISSGCIFYGPSPNIIGTTGYCIDTGWKENDATLPSSTYSRSKLACDLALETMKNTTSLRIRMPLSSKNNPRNLLSKLLKYNQVVEAPNSITFVDNDLSRAIDFTIYEGLTGTFHLTSPKPFTHSEILNEYKKYVPEHQFTSITPDELNGLVSAPRSNCILDNSKIINAGFKFGDPQELLEKTVKEFVENSKEVNE